MIEDFQSFSKIQLLLSTQDKVLCGWAKYWAGWWSIAFERYYREKDHK